MIKIKKTSMALALSLFLSGLHAEDNGFFVSVGYQIGQASQMVKNTGELQKLNDSYKDLQNSLLQLQELKRAISDGSNQGKIQGAVTTINAIASNNYTQKDSSPAWQAVNAAIQTALGTWHTYSERVGGGNKAEYTGSITSDFKHALDEIYKKLLEAQQKMGALNTNATNHSSSHAVAIVKMAAETKTEEQHQTQFTENLEDPKVLLKETKLFLEVIAKGCGSNNSTSGGLKVASVAGISCTYGGRNPWIQIPGSPGGMGDISSYKQAMKMLTAAQQIIDEVNIVQDKVHSLQSQSTQSTKGEQFNQNFHAIASTQQQITDLANQISNDYNSIDITQRNFLNACGDRGNNIQTFYSCIHIQKSIDALKYYNAYYGNQTTQNLQLANDVYYLNQNKENIKNTYAQAQQLQEAIMTMPGNKLALSNTAYTTQDPNAPMGNQAVYRTNLVQQSNLTNALAAMSANPFRNIGVIKSQGNSGVMNGIGVQLGYKQFFGATKRMGARYYGFFDYNHTYIKSDFFNSASNVLTYGVGSDFLYNFINDKEMKKNRLSFGGFAGIALAGTSWLNSDKAVLLNTPEFNASNTPYKASVSASNFQFLFNFGLRMNLADNSKKNEHAIQHGIELGIKIPTINTSYYSFLGAKLEYRRLYSVYLNYVFAY
ncbi:Hop family adhesin SabA/HopD [Helicobacter cetorum]|uniref:Outer membrane protein 5 n=1 Tax=Helicobacter cetorum (strain ATCC BAA-540 / CCUG 52418 / MIT 99-5656) TaxID=1163745 RepID=I0EQ25_HELCM|nr:outer membrane protein [Helicobacter cetorum]AFI05044.1 outer membrane protein 5 [Helicobacter cetorum MIT 99-5656]